MFRRIQIVVLALGTLFILALMLTTFSVAAQDEPMATPRPTATPIPRDNGSDPAAASVKNTSGSIRGTVYHDGDGDGICPEEDDNTLAGVPIHFLSADRTEDFYLQSGDDGTYGLVAAGLGLWDVSAEPLVDQGVVTSEAIRTVILSNQEWLALGVDFCVSSAAAAAPAVVAMLVP